MESLQVGKNELISLVQPQKLNSIAGHLQHTQASRQALCYHFNDVSRYDLVHAQKLILRSIWQSHRRTHNRFVSICSLQSSVHQNLIEFILHERRERKTRLSPTVGVAVCNFSTEYDPKSRTNLHETSRTKLSSTLIKIVSSAEHHRLWPLTRRQLVSQTNTSSNWITFCHRYTCVCIEPSAEWRLFDYSMQWVLDACTIGTERQKTKRLYH